ncbi:thiol:disulfide interchange protein DsbA/DsbL [Basilea psittacipulmonis]|uniref:Thiol:disulfide interchange protein n=1 Tax=Basilea psittacipulmonis DSM 24701 TaxID=1072685 RepID=A0A077DAV6_9BURK|nr:thiol:disulfide interchange protein DsbA/DsbL [Basilea psittacipulmonis]AIL32030.1 hypothetical protein IX83_00640 [Basilea psittacipulmonis DSM 24701]
MKSLLKKLLLACGIALCVVPAVQAQEYKTLDKTLPSNTPDKVEALIFFSYACAHCAAMEPMFLEWQKNTPKGAEINFVPVGFNTLTEALQQLFYTLQALNRMDLSPKVFDAIHQQRLNLFTRDNIQAWLKDQGVSKEQFDAVYDSFGVNAKIKQANNLVHAYNVTATPTIAIAGKYVISPDMVESNSPSEAYQRTYEIAQDLLLKSVKAK